MERIVHDDWSIRLGENISDQSDKHWAALLAERLLMIISTKLSI